MCQSLMRDGRLAHGADGRFAPTAAGCAWLAGIGIEVDGAAPSRLACHACLDWSERRDHLAGPLATRLLDHFLARGWLRMPGRERTRALEVTPTGHAALLPRLAS